MGTLINLDIRTLLHLIPTLPSLRDNKSQDKKDYDTKQIEISDVNIQNTVGGSPDPDNQDNGEDNPKYLKNVNDNYLK